MLPEQWSSPCRNLCTKKYAALVQIPWRVFCKKGCDTDGETWEECVIDCNEICYKDPVLKEYQWTAYIDRSPGPENYSRECFHACVSGCSYKFHMPTEKAEQVQPKRRLKPAMERKSSPTPPVDPMLISDDMPSTSA
uniref:Putative defensin-like protein 165 n=1 Tax=Anthurium amnicola TaxID=1678845 RepID=A0A1D1Z2H2_9ARAE